ACETTATVEGDTLRLVALHDGRRVPGAVFHTIDSDLFNEKVTADKEGKATWKVKYPSNFSIYTSRVAKEAGEAGGKKYEEVREFATLAFSWPLGARGADAEAVALFEQAPGARARWEDFPGFRADVEGRIDGRPFLGKVAVDSRGGVELTTKQKELAGWVQGQLESITLHRAVRPSGEPAARRKPPVLRFADND